MKIPGCLWSAIAMLGALSVVPPNVRAAEVAGPPWARNWSAYSRQAYLSGADSDWDGLNDAEEEMGLVLWGEADSNDCAWIGGAGASVVTEWSWCGVDDDVQPLALPFAFTWGTQQWSRIWAGVNGTLGFGRGQPSPWSRPLPSAAAGPYPFFAICWSQLYLDPAVGGQVWIRQPSTQGVAVCWENLHASNAANSRISFQSELRRNGEMIWRYRDLDGGAGAAPAGIAGLQRDGRGWWIPSASLQSNLALRVAALNGLSSANADSDGDGIPDGIEFRYFTPARPGAPHLDPAVPDNPGDIDRDGLDVIGEYLHGGLDPFYWDSDGDMLSDGYEVGARLLAYDATGIHGTYGDADGDGVTNLTERLHCSQARLADSDGDGYSDATEIAVGGSPSGTGAVVSATWLAPVRLTLGDPGLDGATEAYEMRIEPLSGDNRRFVFQN
ncbi:MAG: hypothetical protein PHR35_05730, partial [Kiritimatiellae bacterium]|nr:hypothetical protein [Kiritimatiellia bacterium]